MKYEILNGKTRQDLMDLVNAMLEKGWIPTGGVSFDIGHGVFLQAIIKHV